MAEQLKRGDQVRQILPKPITGVVDRFTFDQSTGDVGVIVQSVDADGVAHERAFRTDQVEVVEAKKTK